MFTFVMSYMKQNKKHKQTLESGSTDWKSSSFKSLRRGIHVPMIGVKFS